MTLSNEALKALQLLNGGAVVALLAYLSQHPKLALSARGALGLFVLGLVAGTTAFVTSYLTQLALYNESVHREKYKGPRHQTWLWVTFAIAVVSAASFAFGAFAGVNALAHQAGP